MFVFLVPKIVRSPFSSPIFRKTCQQFVNYSSVSQIHQNRIIKDSLSAIENDYHTSLTNLLKSYGFTDHQVAKFFTKFQINLKYNPTTVLKPKLDFFLEVGFSKTQLAKFITSNSPILETSLENRLKPNILLLNSFYRTKEHLVRALFSTYKLLQSKLEANFFPNVGTLTSHGVPHTNIVKFASQHPRALLMRPKKFEKMVQLVATKGFDPCSNLFCIGIHVISTTSSLTWSGKVSLYKSLGWSENNVVSAFIKHPWCMVASEKKIKRVMDFFVNTRQCEPSYLAKNPVLINLSLEERIMPRCFVMDILVKKQLVKKSTVRQYLISNDNFLERYVVPYQDHVPEVLHAYNSSYCFPSIENKSQNS